MRRLTLCHTSRVWVTKTEFNSVKEKAPPKRGFFYPIMVLQFGSICCDLTAISNIVAPPDGAIDVNPGCRIFILGSGEGGTAATCFVWLRCV
mgnify:CR=1 FL=1